MKKNFTWFNWDRVLAPRFYRKKGNLIYVCTEDTPFFIRKYIYYIRPIILLTALGVEVVSIFIPDMSFSWQRLGVIALMTLYMKLCSVSILPKWKEAYDAAVAMGNKNYMGVLQGNTVYLFNENYDALKADLFRIGQEKKLEKINVNKNTDIPVVVCKVPKGITFKFYYVFNMETMDYEIITVEDEDFDRWQKMLMAQSGLYND